VCDFAELSYTTQHRIVLIIFPLIFQTVINIIAQMLSSGEQGDNMNKVIVDSILRPRCALPSLLSRPIMHFQWGRKSLPAAIGGRRLLRAKAI